MQFVPSDRLTFLLLNIFRTGFRLPWSFQQRPQIDRQRDAGDISRLVGGQEQRRVGNVDRLEPGYGKRVPAKII
jgi:hypothetical protein